MYFYQPKSGQFGELLIAEISKEDFKKYNRLTILVAYAKHSGVSRIADSLEKFVAASGQVVAIVGIDQRHTTLEAIQLLTATGARVLVFFDEDISRTYHPKVYWLQGENDGQWIAIGSNNLTAGGLYLNYEMAVIATESPSTNQGTALSELLGSLSDESLEENSELLRVLDDDLLHQLVAEGYLLTEQQVRESEKPKPKGQSSTSGAKTTLFGKSKKPPLPSIPEKYRLPPSTAPDASADGAAAQSAPAPTIAPPSSSAAGTVGPAAAVGSPKGFWKKLSAWDVSLSSSPGQMIIPIQFLSVFPPLSASTTMPSGGSQADTHFDLEYRDGSSAPKLIKGARIVWYKPAPDHPRQNIDFRFTFLDRTVLESLNAGDVLEFVRTGVANPAFIVTRKTAASVGSAKKYDFIP